MNNSFTCRIHRKKFHTILENEILKDPRLSLEAIGAYALLESGYHEPSDFSEKIIEELIKVDYLCKIDEAFKDFKPL